MYRTIGENAIIYEEPKIRVAKVPVDCKWYERLLFDESIRLNKTLARRVPGFYDNSIYLPRMFAPRADELELLQDGGRSCINPDKHVTLELFGTRQTYVEKRKGVGANIGYGRGCVNDIDIKNKLADEELKRYLEDNDLMIVDIDYSFNRPYGVQRKGLALNELEKSKLLEKLGVKHTPVLSVFPFPKDVEKRARKLTDKYFRTARRPKKETYYQEVLLFPGNIRNSISLCFCGHHHNIEDFVKTLKRLGMDPNEFTKELEKDLLHFMEIVPKTLTEAGDEYTVLGFDLWNFADCALAPTGLYVSDLESVGFYKVKKTDLTSNYRLSFYYLEDVLTMMKTADCPIKRSNDGIVEDIINALNKSKYFDVELKEKKENSELGNYLLNIKMECESGVNVDFDKQYIPCRGF